MNVDMALRDHSAYTFVHLSGVAHVVKKVVTCRGLSSSFLGAVEDGVVCLPQPQHTNSCTQSLV